MNCLATQCTIRVLFESVMPAVLCFREGFSFVFPVSDMRLLTPYEIDLLLNGSDESWDIESAHIIIFCCMCCSPCPARSSAQGDDQARPWIHD